MEKLQITKKETVDSMVESLLSQAKENNVSLAGMTEENWQYFLDDAFADGGEVRCEKFTDLSMEYALQFGEFESDAFLNKCWSCGISAVKKIIKHNR